MKCVTCDICGSDEKTMFYESHPYSAGPLVKCVKCGLVYVSPRIKGKQKYEDEEIEETYLQELKWKVAVFKERMKIITKYVCKGRLLDIGCYTGDFLNMAKHDGWHCFGIEPSVSLSQYVRGKYDIEVFHEFLENVKFETNFFDVVTMFHVLEHLDSPTRQLEEIHRILRPGGILVIEVPNVENWIRRLRKNTSWTFNRQHYYHFSYATLQKMLEKGGFSLLRNEAAANCVDLDRMLYFVDFRFKHGFVKRFTGILRKVGIQRVMFRVPLGTSILAVAQPIRK